MTRYINLFIMAVGIAGISSCDDSADKTIDIIEEEEDMVGVDQVGDSLADDTYSADLSEDNSALPDSQEDMAEVPKTVFSSYIEDGSVVSYVDLDRYLGKWYEIATFEIVFQTDCTGSTATYALNDDGTISVTNECYLGSLDGEYKIDTAVAEVVDTESNAKLSVQFPGAPKAPYWIIELDGSEGDEPYEWAVVGSSIPIFLWILSRTPQIPEERLDLIRARLEERGYVLKDLSYTVQPDQQPTM